MRITDILLARKIAGGGQPVPPVPPTPPGPEPELADVMYYDCFGNVLYSYTAQEFAQLTQHPAGVDLPDAKTPLTFNKWNYSFENAQAYVAEFGMLDIGGEYYPTDEKSHFFINLKKSMRVTLTLNPISPTTITIDWGDGSEPETVSRQTPLTHNYETSGEYDISVEGSYNVNTPPFDIVSAGCVTQIFLKDAKGFGASCFSGDNAYGYTALKYVVLPTDMTNLPISSKQFNNCISLEFLVIPQTTATYPSSLTFIDYCSKLKGVVFPDTFWVSVSLNYLVSLRSLCFPINDKSCRLSDATNLQRITYTNASSSVSKCYFLKNLKFHNGITQLSFSSFSNDSNLGGPVWKIPKHIQTLSNNPTGLSALKVLDFSEHEQVVTLSSINSVTNIHYIVVPDALYDEWIVANNWSGVVEKIVKASEFVNPFE